MGQSCWCTGTILTVGRHADPPRVPATRLDAGPGPKVDPASSAAAALDAALSAGDPVPYFQPIIDMATGSATGYEALSRFPRLPGVPVDEVFRLAQACGEGSSSRFWR